MTTSSTVTECCDMQAVNIAPAQINPQPELGALLQAAPLTPRVDLSNVNVYIKETLLLDSGINNTDDEVKFNIVFNVSDYSIDGNSQYYTVTKAISVSKTRLLADGVQIQSAVPVTVVENIVEKKEDSKAVQRMRELAGIPHNKNYV